MALFPKVYNFIADWVVEDEQKEAVKQGEGQQKPDDGDKG